MLIAPTIHSEDPSKPGFFQMMPATVRGRWAPFWLFASFRAPLLVFAIRSVRTAPARSRALTSPLPILNLCRPQENIMKRTYQPKVRRRRRRHGFRHRMRTRAGRATLKARRDKGRKRLAL
jgi:large subunit ribosomal protein L34